MFPSVIRSDNDPSFLADLFAYMTRVLNVHHVFGSTYHPQSQGLVENMHRTMTHIVRSLIEHSPTEWEELIPYCECVLRISPLDSLGGRSPYQVVTGLTPKLPRAMLSNDRVIPVGASEYVSKLLDYLRAVYKGVRAQQISMRQEEETRAQAPGELSAELNVGDLVMIRVEPNARKRSGPNRFQPRVRERIWRICRKISPSTFQLEDADDAALKHEFNQNAENLVRVKLPLFELERASSRVLELRDAASGEWERYRVEKFSIAGTCFLRRVVRDGSDGWRDGAESMWVDLSERVYRWVM
jgi:hypothetical protein